MRAIHSVRDFSATSVFSAVSLCFILSAGALFAQARKSPPAKPLDLNKATVEELQKLPEVGPKVAQAIARFREKAGPFRRVEELLAVPGITRRRLEKIRPHVFVEQGGKPGSPEAGKSGGQEGSGGVLAEAAFDSHQRNRDQGGDHFDRQNRLPETKREDACGSQPQQLRR